MGYWNFLNEIYSFEDACFKYFQEQHKARELEKMLQKELGEGCLWDNDGEYIIDLKDEYDGFVLGSFKHKNREEIRSYKELLTENEKLKSTIEYLESHIGFCKMCHNPKDDCLCG